ncbi:MAG TPA: lipocalin family protein [Chryseolinea sp.]
MNLIGKLIIRVILPALGVVSLSLIQSCKDKNQGYPELVGSWVAYKEDKGGDPLPFLDSMMIDTGNKRHLEFSNNGVVTEWWIPEEPFKYEYTISDSTLAFQNDRYVIIKVDNDELVLDRLYDDEEPGVAPRSPYRVKTFFKRLKSETSGQ